jgi:hypothetical protein
MKGFKSTGASLLGVLFLAVSTTLPAQINTHIKRDPAQAVAGPQAFGERQTTTVTISPIHAAVTAATQTQQFTASTGKVTWSVDGFAGGNATVGRITSNGLYTPPATAGMHTIRATAGAASSSATVAVTDLLAVSTYHNDTARDGVNSQEYALNSTTVSTATFGKLFACAVDGQVYGQPLWIKGLRIGGGIHNVIFVATQNDSAYAFDADANPCITYWHVDLLDTLHGGTANEHAIAWNDIGNCWSNIYPEVGVTSTPVIATSTNTMYLVSASESDASNPGNCSNTHANFYHRLHALSLLTGSEKFNAPVTIAGSVPGTGDGSINGRVSFDSQMQGQRPGLVIDGSKIFVAFGSHEDATPYYGWVFAYTASNVQIKNAVFNTTPNGIAGTNGGIWGGGGAPAVDNGGDVYLATGNGVFDEALSPSDHDYGDSILRLHNFTGSTLNGDNLRVAGYFTPFDAATLAEEDRDLGSGAPVLLPGQTVGPPNLLVQAGKEGIVYLIDRDNMGQYNSGSNDQIVQSFVGPANGLFGTPAFWHNNLYVGGVSDHLRQFVFNPFTGLFDTSVSSLSNQNYSYPGTTPSISSDGPENGIVWALDTSQTASPSGNGGPAILHAYDASNLAVEYWNSTMAAHNRDQAGNAVKFVTPTIANGKVYVATATGIYVYGLLP